MRFFVNGEGLFYYDIKRQYVALVQKVESNIEGYYRKQLHITMMLQHLCTKVGHTSILYQKAMMKSNSRMNCPVTIEDREQSEEIYGPIIAA